MNKTTVCKTDVLTGADTPVRAASVPAISTASVFLIFSWHLDFLIVFDFLQSFAVHSDSSSESAAKRRKLLLLCYLLNTL